MSRDLRVFGGESRLADGSDFSCYTVEWIGKEPPLTIELGGLTYLAVTDSDGTPVRRGGENAS